MSKLITENASTSQLVRSDSMGGLTQHWENDNNDCCRTRGELLSSVNLTSDTNCCKTSKILVFCQKITLRRIFWLIGFSIGTYPFAYVISAIIMSILSFGIYFLKFEDRVRDGYTPITSLSRREAYFLRDFTNSFDDPTLTSVVLRARDGGSLHRLKYIKEAARLHQFFLNNFTAEIPSSGEKIVYSDICGTTCNANIVIDYFQRAIEEEYMKEKRGIPRSSITNLTYPVAKIFGFDMHLEQNFYGVRMRSQNTAKSNHNSSTSGNMRRKPATYTEEAILENITDIEYIQLISMFFQGYVNSSYTQEKLNAWELAVYKYATQNYVHEPIEIVVLGVEIVNQELIKDSRQMGPYFVAGFFAMLLIVVVSVLGSSMLFDAIHAAKLIVALGAVACPILAVTVTFGLFSLAQLRTNSVMLITPFLVMGIGVNGSFLMIHSWLRLPNDCTIPQRLGYMLEEIGPSITISTLTNVITFGIGALTPTPEIALFCFETAIALGFAYIFTLVLLCPLLYLASTLEGKRKYKFGFSKIIDKMNAGLKCYCWLVASKPFGVLATVCILIYWIFGVIGVMNIETRLDVEKILPKNSPLQEANAILTNIVWMEYYPVTVFVNSPLNIENDASMKRFNAMVNEFETLEDCRGKEFTLLWFRDYEKYWLDASLYDFDYFAYDVVINETVDNSITTAVKPTKHEQKSQHEVIDYSKLSAFLQSPIYKHWKTFLKLRNDTEIPVERFWFLVVYENVKDWKQRIELMQHWRGIANSYKDLNVSVWQANSMFVDQMLSLKSVAVQTCIWTLICMTAVCALFIQNPFSVIIASVTILSISFGVIGFLSWWNLDLDPATLCAILMCIGMSVDFTAHVSYQYQVGEKKIIAENRVRKLRLNSNTSRLEYTLKSVSWPILEGAVSTIACILPLSLLKNYIPLVFVKTILLVVMWGLIHGLVLLPTCLSQIPNSLLTISCYRTILRKRQLSGNTSNIIDGTTNNNNCNRNLEDKKDRYHNAGE
ncbi:unnamed protein product [Thelazia callipaeda]|uniref:SSD domain-containing protein n=1 Tax=Thelazia callipaeda TaxID=103827 RepID=A0A0N5CMG7_THECL|nr:unnamed protein product [Thelazia callipaeda]